MAKSFSSGRSEIALDGQKFTFRSTEKSFWTVSLSSGRTNAVMDRQNFSPGRRKVLLDDQLFSFGLPETVVDGQRNPFWSAECSFVLPISQTQFWPTKIGYGRVGQSRFPGVGSHFCPAKICLGRPKSASWTNQNLFPVAKVGSRLPEVWPSRSDWSSVSHSQPKSKISCPVLASGRQFLFCIALF